MDQHIAPANQYRPQHTLSFPTTHSSGLLLVRDADVSIHQDWDDGWEALAEAIGSVIIPAGKDVFRGMSVLQQCHNLQWLYLSETHITDRGLMNLYGLTGLDYLVVKDTQVTEKGIAALQQALPHCKIVYEKE